jgi:gamma-glutamyltranspeptidase/glutathione hydrolase
VDSFYDGDIGHRIAEYVRAAGGLLTAEDMAAHRAREVAPLCLEWQRLRICTPPPTAGGLTPLQVLRALAALGWERLDWRSPQACQLVVEAARAAWHDRLTLLGDPEHTDVPIDRLLSDEHAAETAERVRAAVQTGRRLEARTDGRPADGTVHMSFADADGNMVALTQTHGGGYGSHVTVGGLGLTLGHGMSRFTPQPNHPNSPGPGKRPLHNMCATVVLREGIPILALGGAGGRRIVNAALHALLHFAGRGAPVGEALAAPRFHTEGGDTLWLDRHYPETAAEALRGLGYDVQHGAVANLHAIQRDPATGELAGLTEPRHPDRGAWGVAAVEANR